MSSGLLPPPGVGLMVSQRGGDNDFGDGGGDVVVTDSFLRTIRGETSVAGRARGEGRGGRVGRDEEISLVDDENGEELDSAGSDFVVPRDGVEELRDGGWEEDGDDEVGTSRAISGGMGIASSAIGSALMAAGMIGEVDGLGQVYGMGGEEEEEDDAINEDMARLGMSSTGGAGRKGRETTTRRKARKKGAGAGTVGVGGKGGKGKQDTTESTLRLRVDGQRHAIRALEKVIADLKMQLSRKKGGKGGSGSGGANVVSPERRKGGGTSSLRRSLNAFPPPPPPPTINHYQHEIGRTLRNDLSTTLKQNKTLQVEVKKLKEQLKESKEKEERGREITSELKRYSNKLRNELEELREELINKGDELDIARKERKRVSKKVGKKKAKQLVEEKERREKEAEVRGENITQEDIDRIKRDITSLKQERKNDREVIEGLNREANGLRHRLAIISKKR